MDRIDLFRIFVHVADCGSFTRAADTLSVPRSSVSTAIRELEERVGARLLHRTTRRLSLTQEGEIFHERCRQLVEDVEDTVNLFRDRKGALTGRLRVSVPGRIGRLIVVPALPAFLDLHPGLDIELGVTDKAVDLIEGRVDCVLRIGPLTNSQLIARSIGLLPILNVASPAYFARFGTPTSPDDMKNHLAVQYASPTTGRIEPWEWVENGQTCTARTRGRVTVTSAEDYVGCCVAGLGLIQVPAYDVRDQLASGALREVMPDHRAAPMDMTLLYSHRRLQSRRVQAFTTWLTEILKREIT